MAIAERILHLHRLEDLRPDEMLIRAAQDGEREAASALVERYYPRVRSFVSYLTNGRSNAEDLTQEVFARALTALGRFNGNYRFEPWLLRIAKNLVIDEARRRVHQPEVTDPADLPEIEPAPISLDNVWDSISQQMSSSTVNAALERLPLRQRTVLVLREIEEMAYADIAQVVGTNVRGVEATLRRARARFRIEVANLESDEAHAAVCRRTLRLVASDGAKMSEEASQHLARCPECRGKAATARRADRLFGMLPPVALAGPTWRSRVVASFAERAARGRGLVEVVRTGVTQLATLPIAQIVEVAATVVIAAVVSTTMSPPDGQARIAGSPVAVEGQASGVTPPVAAGAGAQGGPTAASTAGPSAQAGSGGDAATGGGLPIPPLPDVEVPLDLEELLGSGLLAPTEGLVEDPVGTLAGIVDDLPGTITSTIDGAGSVPASEESLGGVTGAAGAVTEVISDVPVVGEPLSGGLGQLPAPSATPSAD